MFAKYREVTKKIAPDGSATVLSDVEGTFARSSNGKVRIERRDVTNGSSGAAIVELEDLAGGKVYRYWTGQTRVSTSDIPRRPQPSTDGAYIQAAKLHALGEQVINGIDCFGFPVYKTVAGKAGKEEIGVGWRSLENDLQVKSENHKALSDGSRIEYVREIYDVQVGAEPDSKLFSLSGAAN